MRLGEGTGAALAMNRYEGAAKLLCEMATFADAGVSNKGANGWTSMIRSLLIAIQFLTRLPVPRSHNSSEIEILVRRRCLLSVGWCDRRWRSRSSVFRVAKDTAAIGLGASLAIIFTAFVTNGFHEDETRGLV